MPACLAWPCPALTGRLTRWRMELARKSTAPSSSRVITSRQPRLNRPTDQPTVGPAWRHRERQDSPSGRSVRYSSHCAVRTFIRSSWKMARRSKTAGQSQRQRMRARKRRSQPMMASSALPITQEPTRGAGVAGSLYCLTT